MTDDITVLPWPLQTNPELLSNWVLFGFLNEYLGRRVIEDGDRVEGFYPNESAAAEKFGKYLETYSKELGLTQPIEKVVETTGHLHFVSKRLTAMLDAMYGDTVLDRQITLLEPRRTQRCGRAAVSRQCFSGGNSFRLTKNEASERFSYLLGAYIRYGEGNSLVLANATHKAELLRDLLVSIYCPRVSWEIDQRGAPVKNTITFEPTDELREFLSKA